MIRRCLPIAPLLLTGFLAGCGDSDAEIQAQRLVDSIEDQVWADIQEYSRLDEVGQAEAIALQDDKIIDLLSQCRSIVFKQASEDFKGPVTMVEKDSAAQFIIAAGSSTVKSFPERVETLRGVQEAKFPVIRLNTMFAVIYGTMGMGPQVQGYRCKLGPGPIARAAEKYTARY